MRFAITCLLCVGCDKVFLDGPTEITIEYSRDVIGTHGLSQETYEPMFVARSASDQAIEIERVAADTSRMETSERFYRLQYTTAFSMGALWSDAEHIQFHDRVLGRVARTPVPPDTTVEFKDAVPLPVASSLTPIYGMSTTGQWSFSPSVVATLPFKFDLAKSISVAGPLALLDDVDDTVMLIEYAAAPGSDYYEIVGTLQRRGTVVAPIVVPGPLQPAIRDRCIELTAKRAGILARLSTVAPAAYSTEASNWAVTALPHEAVLNIQGHVLAFDGSSTDQTRTVRFSNPFGGVVRASLSAGRIRKFHRTAGDPGVDLRYGMDIIDQPVDGATCVPSQLAGTEVSLITSISIDGAALVRDDTVVAAGKPVTVSWQATGEGADYFSIAVVKVDPGATNLADRAGVAARYLTTEHSLVLPRDLLVAGNLYYVGVAAVLGAPNAKTGDFATYRFPIIAADASSGAFSVE